MTKRPPTPGETPERCKVPTAVAITGLSTRTIQNLAAQGKIPGAAKLAGQWTFDLARLRRWVRQLEGETACRGNPTTSTGEEEPGTPGFRSTAETTDEAYERLLS